MRSVTNAGQARVAAASIGAGLIASICCGGSLVFVPLGLGAAYSALGLSRYIPQALAAGALAIAAINYGFYAHRARCTDCADGPKHRDLRQRMMWNAAAGLVVMVSSFVFLEWLNHAVVNGHRFLTHHVFRAALIPGVSNDHLAYALATFAVLGALWTLPFPQQAPGRPGSPSP
jgi:hypothetical protein